MVRAKAAVENTWHYRILKRAVGASLKEAEVLETGTSGVWLFFLMFLQPLCISEKPVHPLPLLQGSDGTCFLCKALWDLIWKELDVILWSYQGSVIFFYYLYVSGPIFLSERLRANLTLCASLGLLNRASQWAEPLHRVSDTCSSLQVQDVAFSLWSSCVPKMETNGGWWPQQLMTLLGSSFFLCLAWMSESESSPGWRTALYQGTGKFQLSPEWPRNLEGQHRQSLVQEGAQDCRALALSWLAV